MKTFLIELQNRPDGLVNSTITSYSSDVTTLSMFYQRIAAALVNTTFLSVTLMIIDQNGTVMESRNITTQYTPPSPGPDDPEPDPEPESEG